MTFTATQLAYRALRDLGCLRPGQTTSTDVLNDILVSLNELIEFCQLDRLMIFTIVINAYNLIAGQQQYTIGPSGTDFVAARPTQIEEANIILNTISPVIRRPLGLLNDQEWAAIRVQQLPFAIPNKLYYDGGFDPTLGFATINLWPGPLASYQLELFTWQQLQSFADLTTAYNFPPAYGRFLRTNLASNIAPMMALYNKLQRISAPVSQAMLQLVTQQAAEAKEQIQSYNAPDPLIACDPSYLQDRKGSGYNYLDGLSGSGGQ